MRREIQSPSVNNKEWCNGQNHMEKFIGALIKMKREILVAGMGNRFEQKL